MSGPVASRAAVSRDRVRAATLVAPGRYEIRDYPAPIPRRVASSCGCPFSGICGTDKHTYQGHTTQYAGTEAVKEDSVSDHPGARECGHRGGDRTGARRPAVHGLPTASRSRSATA